MTTTVSQRQLNRWTLARQLLLERVNLDAAAAIESLAGMQAQYSPSPYIGLWSRLAGFQRQHLESALKTDLVLRATLMRGTLHLVAARDFDRYRVASRNPSHIYTQTVQQLRERGVDVEAIRKEIVEAVREQPRSRQELRSMSRERIPPDLPEWAAFSIVALSGDLMNLADDGRFGYFGGSRYRVAPETQSDAVEAFRHVAAAYFAAFGPATRADLAQWSGKTVGEFAGALGSLDLVSFRAEDGRTLLDLPNARRPDADTPVPVRFLPKWDNLLLAYARRERVLPEAYRKIVIRKNGDVLPTFLVDGVVAGTWEAPLKGKPILKLTALRDINHVERAEVEQEAERLLVWLRSETDTRELCWAGA